jgi:hypothetical protein
VTGQNILMKVNPVTDGLTWIAGTGIPGYTGDGGSARQAQLSQPTAIALDPRDNIWFIDWDNNAVRRIGLRTLELQREKDRWGASFRFAVNGVPFFAKGANWIPAHSFVAGLTRADYERDLRSAREAHMNMIRVWGGGIYESEDFYDLCDELGLLVWQDLMFACTLYPADAAFLASSRAEAEFQVRRLRANPCQHLARQVDDLVNAFAVRELAEHGGGPNDNVEPADAGFERHLMTDAFRSQMIIVVSRQNCIGLKPIDYSAGSLHTPNHDRDTAMAGNSDYDSCLRTP